MFNSEAFKTAWTEWKSHKQNIQKLPYTETAENKALATLYKKSHGIEELAIASIDWSIECNWANIYIKNNYNGNGKTNGSTTSSATKGTSTDRVEALRKW